MCSIGFKYLADIRLIEQENNVLARRIAASVRALFPQALQVLWNQRKRIGEIGNALIEPEAVRHILANFRNRKGVRDRLLGLPCVLIHRLVGIAQAQPGCRRFAFHEDAAGAAVCSTLLSWTSLMNSSGKRRRGH